MSLELGNEVELGVLLGGLVMPRNWEGRPEIQSKVTFKDRQTKNSEEGRVFVLVSEIRIITNIYLAVILMEGQEIHMGLQIQMILLKIS